MEPEQEDYMMQRLYGDDVRRGVCFDTSYETGCVALDAPDSHGSFLALDSDGVECHFNVVMVVRVHAETSAKAERLLGAWSGR